MYLQFCAISVGLVPFKTKNAGDAIMIAVGAMMVGGIVMTHSAGKDYKKGDEAGYFEYGGSTIALLFKKGAIKVRDDILRNSKQLRQDGGVGYETSVRMGQKVAEVND